MLNEDTKLGPWGCLCTSFSHRMVGDGCEICNPELAKMYEEFEVINGSGTYRNEQSSK